MNIQIRINPAKKEQRTRGVSYLFSETTFIGEKKTGKDFCENHSLAADFWNPAMYEQQWREGLARIKTEDTSCLILSMQNPRQAPLLHAWILYKIGNNIHIQDHLFAGKLYTEIMSRHLILPSNCYDFFIEPRLEVDEDGDKISEWIVAL